MIIKIDKPYRRKLFAAYLLSLALCTLLIWWGIPRITAAIHVLDLNKLEIVAIVFMLSFSLPAAYLIVIGRRIIKSRQMPCPGMKVIRDTTVIEGKPALQRGRALIVLGIFSIFMAIVGSLATHYFFNRLRAPILFVWPPKTA
jgi:hypothetical protein